MGTAMKQNSGTFNECSQNLPMSTPVTFIGEYPPGGGLKAEADNTNSISNTTQMKWKKNNIKDELKLQQ